VSDGTTIWYRVRDLDAARRFYTGMLGFTESFSGEQDDWTRLERDGTHIALAPGEPDPDGSIAHVDVDDVKAEAERLRAQGVEVGVVLELHGEMRLLDVRDPDGNRIELGQELAGS
jgi:catechol 2,3-dioxygenase-like lactoylglutathione lyase family enzyme